MTKISGSCLCGSVSYAGDAEVKMVVNCHCLDCQKVTGSVHGTMVFVEEEKLAVTGTTSTFDHPADSGNTLTKVFCPNCGSQMMGKNTARPGMVGLRAGALDQKELVTPGADLYCSRAIPTTPLADATKKFEKMFTK